MFFFEMFPHSSKWLHQSGKKNNYEFIEHLFPDKIDTKDTSTMRESKKTSKWPKITGTSFIKTRYSINAFCIHESNYVHWKRGGKWPFHPNFTVNKTFYILLRRSSGKKVEEMGDVHTSVTTTTVPRIRHNFFPSSSSLTAKLDGWECFIVS